MCISKKSTNSWCACIAPQPQFWVTGSSVHINVMFSTPASSLTAFPTNSHGRGAQPEATRPSGWKTAYTNNTCDITDLRRYDTTAMWQAESILVRFWYRKNSEIDDSCVECKEKVFGQGSSQLQAHTRWREQHLKLCFEKVCEIEICAKKYFNRSLRKKPESQ